MKKVKQVLAILLILILIETLCLYAGVCHHRQ